MSIFSIYISETALRKKWKYLREKFVSEYIKRPTRRSGGAAERSCRPSKWPYFPQLMFLKDIVRSRASSGSISPTTEAAIVPPADPGPAEDVTFNDAASHGSQDSLVKIETNESEEAIGNPKEFLENAGPSFQLPGSSKRKRESQEEDFYQRMCNVEERKLQYLLAKRIQKETEADREDADLMFFKTLLPHVRKIPEHIKLRFQSRIQSVVEEFAYGHHNPPDTVV